MGFGKVAPRAVWLLPEGSYPYLGFDAQEGTAAERSTKERFANLLRSIPNGEEWKEVPDSEVEMCRSRSLPEWNADVAPAAAAAAGPAAGPAAAAEAASEDEPSKKEKSAANKVKKASAQAKALAFFFK